MDPAMSSDMTRNTTGRYRWVYFSVAPSVGVMTQLSYDDLGSVQEMHDDCEAAVRHLPEGSESAPSLRYEDFPHDLPKPEIEVSEAATRIANALELHLD
jgi:hypothetical protein